MHIQSTDSTAVNALMAVGDKTQAEDVAVLEAAIASAHQKINTTRSSLVERLIYGPQPDINELCSGVDQMLKSRTQAADNIVDSALKDVANGQAFTAENKISSHLRKTLASNGAYGFTIPTEFGGLGLDYSQLAYLEENFTARGLGALAVEISGQLTIGSSALLGYGSAEQCAKLLPTIANGTLIAFALTEVGVGVNAKRIQAWVELDEKNGCWRLHAKGACNKLYITSATYSGLAAVVARKGKTSKEIGLFIVELPKTDIDGDYGFQRMMAADAVNYARQRIGVGGEIIKHELPRLNIVKMLGGTLISQALAHLSLAQDADGVDLTGLRDMTKSVSAQATLESLIACERVIGGRSLDKHSRITEARPIIHAFGIVESENDLIRLGMVKELTANFSHRLMAGMLKILQNLNIDNNGQPVTEDKRILKLSLGNFLRFPARSFSACLQLIFNKGFWQLAKWVVVNAAINLAQLPVRLVPTNLLPRYKHIPRDLRSYLRYGERGLKHCRWSYLFLNIFHQLELTQAQIPLQRMARKIELLTAMTVLACHASKLDASCQNIAVCQLELLRKELGGLGLIGEMLSDSRLRKRLNAVAEDILKNRCTLIADIEPQPFAHPWDTSRA